MRITLINQTSSQVKNMGDLHRASGSLMDKALCYKPEGSSFGTGEVNEFFILHNPSSRTELWGLLSL
jgi:hypothetical protein